MVHMRKFTFDTSFDPDEPEDAPAAPEVEPTEPEPPEPTYGQAELDAAVAAARAEGRAEGEAHGRAAAEREIEATLAAALSAIAERMETLVAERRTADAGLEREAVRVARAAAARVLPDLARRHGLEELAAMVRDCLAELTEEPRVVVRVADALLDPLRARLDREPGVQSFAGHLVLLADDRLGPGDLKVEWADGGAVRDGAALMRAVDTALARAAADEDAAPWPGGPTDAMDTAGGAPDPTRDEGLTAPPNETATATAAAADAAQGDVR